MAIKICNNIVLSNVNGASGNNIAIGTNTGLAAVTTGVNNIVIGPNTGTCLTTGSNNNFFGCNAGCSVTTGSNNIIVGNYAGTTGLSDTIFLKAGATCLKVASGALTVNGSAVGGASPISVNATTKSIYSCTSGTPTGYHNIVLGTCAGAKPITGNSNVVLGKYAGQCLWGGFRNVLLGELSGKNICGGYNNVAIGTYAGCCLVGAYDNIFMGWGAGRYSYCNYNIAIGRNAGSTMTTAYNNIMIGCATGSNGFGLGTITTCCNIIMMGNCYHTDAIIQIGWTTVSDIRDKCVWGPVPHGRSFLQKLETIEFSFKDRETGILDENSKRRYGFSAQNVLEAEGDNPIITNNKDLDKLKITNDYLIPVLVNAINELSTELDELKARIVVLEAK